MVKWYICIHSLIHSLNHHVFFTIESHKIPGNFSGPEVRAVNGITRNLGLVDLHPYIGEMWAISAHG